MVERIFIEKVGLGFIAWPIERLPNVLVVQSVDKVPVVSQGQRKVISLEVVFNIRPRIKILEAIVQSRAVSLRLKNGQRARRCLPDQPYAMARFLVQRR